MRAYCSTQHLVFDFPSTSADGLIRLTVCGSFVMAHTHTHTHTINVGYNEIQGDCVRAIID